MHEPGKHVGPSRDKWQRSPGNGPLGGNEFERTGRTDPLCAVKFGESDLDRLLAELKVPEEIYPAPGFYARVMDRIEARQSKSIWAVFLQPLFGRRLAVVSGVLMLLLGAALFVPGSEVDDQLLAQGQTTVVSQSVAELQPIYAPDQDKDAVLVNLVTYQEH